MGTRAAVLRGSATGDYLDAGHGAGESRLGPSKIDFFLGFPGQAGLGPSPGLACPRDINLLRPLGRLREDDHLFWADLRKTSVDRQDPFLPSPAVLESTNPQGTEKRRVPGQNTKISLAPRRDDLVHGFGDDETIRSGTLEEERCHGIQATAWSFRALSWASSIGPTM